MQTDIAFQTVFSAIKKVKWRECEQNNLYEWYYAESQIYIIHSKESDAYFFVKAKSPLNAYEHVVESLKK